MKRLSVQTLGSTIDAALHPTPMMGTTHLGERLNEEVGRGVRENEQLDRSLRIVLALLLAALITAPVLLAPKPQAYVPLVVTLAGALVKVISVLMKLSRETRSLRLFGAIAKQLPEDQLGAFVPKIVESLLRAI